MSHQSIQNTYFPTTILFKASEQSEQAVGIEGGSGGTGQMTLFEM